MGRLCVSLAWGKPDEPGAKCLAGLRHLRSVAQHVGALA